MNNENEKLRRAFLASAVALVVVGIIFVVTVCVSLSQIGEATNTQPIEETLTESKE